MTHPDLVATGPAQFHPSGDDLLPDDPFTCLNYHFGMLLGVDDFETEQAYHRGKTRLHQAWLHGPGVVWGLQVALDKQRSEVRVEPGLALDGAGRELRLDTPACLDPAAWFEAHEADVTLYADADVPTGAKLAFDAHVVARFASCLTRAVPALAEPCEGARVETAYSRVWETIDLKLVPGLGPPPIERYPRVRVLLGLREPETGNAADAEAAAAREEVLATAAADRRAAALDAFRAMANADAAELAPAQDEDGPRVLTPEDLSTSVVLASIHGLALAPGDNGLLLFGGELDLALRRSHIQTATVQELTAAVLLAEGAAAEPPEQQDDTKPDGPTTEPDGPTTEPDGPTTEPDGPTTEPSGGPTVTKVSLKPDGSELKKLVLTLSAALDGRSVRSEAFSVSALGPDGWEKVEFDDPPNYAEDPAPPTVTLDLLEEPDAPWQVIARGTGPQPLVDAGSRRLGDGQDFVHIESPTAPAPSSGGPQVTWVSLDVPANAKGAKARRELTLTLSAALDARSVHPAAFSVTTLGPDGWVKVDLSTPPSYTEAGEEAAFPTVTLLLKKEPPAPWQVIARGTGPQPLVDGEVRRLGDGEDFVHMKSLTPTDK
jgi:hypothetical protein